MVSRGLSLRAGRSCRWAMLLCIRERFDRQLLLGQQNGNFDGKLLSEA